jgi:hypothetical protein
MNGGVLTGLRARLLGWLTLRTLLLLAGLAAAAAIGYLLLDAAIDLSDDSRAFAPWTLGILALLICATGLVNLQRLSDLRVAKRFESLETSLGNRLTNAVQLSVKKGESHVEEFLREEAVALGKKSAANLKTWHVARQGIQIAFVVCLVSAGVWIFVLSSAREMFDAVAPRFLDPRGDHPPYSRLKIQVTPKNAEVLYGSQLEIKATARGKPADKLWLVAKTGTNQTRTLMFLAPDKSFFQTLANLREPTEFFVTDGAARSFRYPIKIRYTPQITLVEVTTEFPAYTSKPVRTGKLTEEIQALPEGTKISFRVASNRPLKEGALELTPVLGGKKSSVRLQPGGQSNIVSGSFTLNEPTLFNISVSDVGGLSSGETRKGRFNISPDERPHLFVLEPGRDAVATPTIAIPVHVQATDDYAVSRVVWLRGFNRSIERPFNMKVALKNGPQSVDASGSFALNKLGVRPGDVIEYYFEAADNYPKGPNLTLSKLYRLQIISEEQYQQILRQAAARKALFEPYFQLNAWLRRMAEHARNLESKADSSASADKKSLADDAKDLADDLEKFQEELGKLLDEALMFDVEKAFRETLVAQHTQVGQMANMLKQLAANGQVTSDKLKEITDQLNAMSATDEEDVDQPAQQIATVARLMARADTFVKLAQQEATIARLLQRFNEQTNGLSRVEQMELQELAHQQRRVQEEMRKLLSALDDSLAELPADAQYDPLRTDVTNFVAAVAEAKIEQDLGDASKVLADLDASTGFILAKSAAEKMDKLIGKCNGMQQQGKQCMRFKPKLQNAMGNTLEQILAAMGAGNNGSGQNGFSMFNDDVGLYGPNAERAGQQTGGRGSKPGSGGRRTERVASDNNDPGVKGPDAPGRVRLQPDAKFPLRYRDLVGDYFRAIAESEAEGEKP